MFARLESSWNLAKASWSVLRADKELIIFPILSGIGVTLVSITFFIPMILSGMADAAFSEDAQIFGTIVLFIYYVVNYTVIFFANTALVGAAMIRLKGGDPTVGDGFRIAMSHFASILGYALIAATVGLIIRRLSERGGLAGAIVAGLGGLAWNLATFLVVPILVTEEVGPIEAIKRSAGLLKKTWGEQIVGNLGIGAVFGLISFGIILILAPLLFLGIVTESMFILIGTVIIGALAFTFMGIIQSSLRGIYVAAVYQYAAEGKTGNFFEERMVKEAFRPK